MCSVGTILSNRIRVDALRSVTRLVLIWLLANWACSAIAADANVYAIPDRGRAYVVDDAHAIGSEARFRADAIAREIERSYGVQFFVLAVDDTSPETIEAYAQRAFERWKPGQRGVDNGVLLVIATEAKGQRLRLHIGYGLEGILNDAVSKRILAERVRPALDSGGAAPATIAALEAVRSALAAVPADALPRATRSKVSTAADDSEIKLFGEETRVSRNAMRQLICGFFAVFFATLVGVQVAQLSRPWAVRTAYIIVPAAMASMYYYCAEGELRAVTAALWLAISVWLLVAYGRQTDHSVPAPAEKAEWYRSDAFIGRRKGFRLEPAAETKRTYPLATRWLILIACLIALAFTLETPRAPLSLRVIEAALWMGAASMLAWALTRPLLPASQRPRRVSSKSSWSISSSDGTSSGGGSGSDSGGSSGGGGDSGGGGSSE